MAGKKKPGTLPPAILPPLAVLPSKIVTNARLSKTDWRVLVALCARLNRDTGLCNPSVERIARDIGIDPRHVYTSRERLKRIGIIDWARENTGRRVTCRYEIFGFPVDDEGMTGSDKILTGSVTLNTDETCQTNIEGEHRNKNIPYKHTASSKDDGPEDDYQKEDSKVPINIHGKVTIIERRMKKNGVTAIDLNDLDALSLEAEALGELDELKKIYGHVERVRDWAIVNAPPELDHMFEPED